MKSIHKFFLSFLLVIIGLMGLSVVSSARVIDSVPTDLTDEICFHFSEPLGEVNSDTTTNTYYCAFGTGNYAESILMIINVVPYSSDAGIVCVMNPHGYDATVEVYCNKQFNVSYKAYNYSGSVVYAKQLNNNPANSRIDCYANISKSYTKYWFGNLPVDPYSTTTNVSPCFFIEDIIDAQGVVAGQNIYNAISSIDSDTGVIRTTVASIDTTLDSIDWSTDHISDLLSSGGAIYGFLDSLVDEATDINLTLTNIDGTLTTLSTNVLNIWSRMPKVSTYTYYDDSGRLQTYSGQYLNLFLSSLGRDFHSALSGLNTIHSDLTSLSSGFQSSIQTQTDTIMGQPVQVTQPSFSDSSSVESITDDYISDLDPSSALLQDVSTPLQGMNFWRDKVNELILTNNQMSVFILYILSIGLVVFFIGRRIRSE